MLYSFATFSSFICFPAKISLCGEQRSRKLSVQPWPKLAHGLLPARTSEHLGVN